MAIMLSLFSDAEMSGLSSLRSEAPAAPAAGVVDPCKACALKGLCDHDECAAKLFPIDAPFANSLFPNLGVYVQFLKSHGWL